MEKTIMKRNVGIIIISVLFVLIIVFGIIYKTKQDNEIVKEELGTYYMDGDNEVEFLQKLCMKNGNWKNYPLSKEFLSKYNEKDGIFGDMQFDKVEVFPYREKDNSADFLARAPHIEITKNNDLIVYKYSLKTHGTFSKPPYYPILDDVELTEPVYMIPNKQGLYDFKMPFNKSYRIDNLSILTSNDIGYLNAVATTNHFQTKYPHFLDLFIHYSPLSFNKIMFIEKESDLDNNIAIFEVDSILECKKRKYRVKLILDDKLYLDDAEVEMIEEKEYVGNNLYITPKLIYINSNWDNLELTDNFIQKYKDVNSLIKDIDNINYDIEMESDTIVRNKEYVNTFVDKSMNKVSYKFVFIDDKDGNIDDVLVTKIN